MNHGNCKQNTKQTANGQTQTLNMADAGSSRNPSDPSNLQNNNEEIKQEVLDPELDAQSIHFNPLKALYAENFVVIDDEDDDDESTHVGEIESRIPKSTNTSNNTNTRIAECPSTFVNRDIKIKEEVKDDYEVCRKNKPDNESLSETQTRIQIKNELQFQNKLSAESFESKFKQTITTRHESDSVSSKNAVTKPYEHSHQDLTKSSKTHTHTRPRSGSVSEYSLKSKSQFSSNRSTSCSGSASHRDHHTSSEPRRTIHLKEFGPGVIFCL